MKTGKEDPGSGEKKKFITDFLDELKRFEAPGDESAAEALLSLGATLPPDPPPPSSDPKPEPTTASALPLLPAEFPDLNDAEINHFLDTEASDLQNLGAAGGSLHSLEEQEALAAMAMMSSSPTKHGPPSTNLIRHLLSSPTKTPDQSMDTSEMPEPARPQSWPSPGHAFRSPPTYDEHKRFSASLSHLDQATLPSSANAPNVEETAQSTIKMLGQNISLIQSAELPPGNFVRTSDIFHKFFSKRHWDEFKTILEKNGVQPLVVAEQGRRNFTVEVMQVSEVENLLLRNEARKEGFVRCRTLDASTDQDSSLFSDSIILATDERPPVQLSSGIKTRHGDHSDIVYVKLEGQTLPAVLLSGEEWVRLADVQSKIFGSEPASNRHELERLRRACNRLRLGVEKIPASIKWRLVAQAGSARSHSLHVIPTRLLPRLVTAIRNPSQLKKVKKHRSHDDSEISSIDGGSPRSDDLSEDDFEDDDSQRTLRTRSVTPSGELRSRHASGSSSSLPAGPSPPPIPVPKNWGADLSEVQPAQMFLLQKTVTPELIARCRPCAVLLPRSTFLKVAVCSPRATQPSVFGNYYDYLFLYPESPCIECTVCGEMLAVRAILRHHHSSWFDHQQPKLHMYLPGFAHCPPRFDLWARLDRKLRDFGMFEQIFAYPDNLIDYYRKRWSKEIKPPPASKLKSVSSGGRASRRPSRAVTATDRSGRLRPDSPVDVDKLIEEAVHKYYRRPKTLVEPLERLTSSVKIPKVGCFDQLYERTLGPAAVTQTITDWPIGLDNPDKDAFLERLYGIPN